MSFSPEEMLEPGTVYECKFHLQKITEVPDQLKTLEFQFQTIQQSIFVEMEGLHSLDEAELKWQQLKGILKTADVARAEQVEQVLTGSQDGKALQIDWTHNSDGTLHEFVIDSISRTMEKEEVKVKWDGRVIQSKDHGEEVVVIPPLGDLKLMKSALSS